MVHVWEKKERAREKKRKQHGKKGCCGKIERSEGKREEHGKKEKSRKKREI